MLTLTGADAEGNPVRAVFPVYVVITDGKDPNATEPTPKEEVVYPPKIIVSSYRCTSESGEIAAGETVRLCITLTNTGKYEAASNMTVTVISPNENFTLLNASDTQYIESFGAEDSIEITYEFSIGLATLPGQYDFGLNYNYYYNKALSGQGAGSAKITVGGKLNMRFDAPLLPAEVTVSDTIEAQLHAMNLSRVTAYNVRAVIETDGLRPSGTVFIGNLDGGTSQTASVQIAITVLSGSDSAYGKTAGQITYYYEDADGNEYQQAQDITLTVKSPFSEKPTEPEDNPSQWWTVMLVVTCAIAVLGASLFVTCRKRKPRHE